jgi:hypothetical protein
VVSHVLQEKEKNSDREKSQPGEAIIEYFLPLFITPNYHEVSYLIGGNKIVSETLIIALIVTKFPAIFYRAQNSHLLHPCLRQLSPIHAFNPLISQLIISFRLSKLHN